MLLLIGDLLFADYGLMTAHKERHKHEHHALVPSSTTVQMSHRAGKAHTNTDFFSQRTDTTTDKDSMLNAQHESRVSFLSGRVCEGMYKPCTDRKGAWAALCAKVAPPLWPCQSCMLGRKAVK